MGEAILHELYHQGKCQEAFDYAQTLFQEGRTYRDFGTSFIDNLCVCAYYTKHHSEALEMTSYLLDYRTLSAGQRRRIEFNHHFSVPIMKEQFSDYPKDIVDRLTQQKGTSPHSITFSVTTCKRLDLFTRTMNSFLQACLDVEKIQRWLCVDDNSSPEDREKMKELYPFFDFIWKTPEEKGHPRSMNIIREQVHTTYLFHCEDDWQFFCRKPFLTEAMEIFETDRTIGQVLINKNYSETENCHEIVGGTPDVTLSGLNYRRHTFFPEKEEQEKYLRWNPGPHNVYWPHFSFRPSMLRVEIYQKIGPFREGPGHFEMEYAERFVRHHYKSVFFNTIYCYHIGRLTSERHLKDKDKANAYELNETPQF